MMNFRGKPEVPSRLTRRGTHLLAASALLAASICGVASAHAQSAGIDGTVTDSKGAMIPKATVTARNEQTGKISSVTADSQGHFTFSSLPNGAYDVEAAAEGFSLTIKQAVHPGATLSLMLPIAQASTDITVDADQTHSVAAAYAPMDALLNETSARTEITSAFINNFTSPVSDYGEDVAMAPGTVTLNSNGVGLGQSKTVFRGFPDGDYDIDFDGIPFYDTNSPTHHSWAFFPSQFLGGIDFDRSPGTASTIGPTPFGGSIHLLSKPFDPISDVRGTFSGGSFNTYLYDLEYDSGSFGPGHKFNTMVDVHHLQSHGYQTLNNQERNGGDIQFQYKLSDRTTITGFSAVIWLDANTPNFNATRCQMYGSTGLGVAGCAISGTPTTANPAGTPLPYTGAGINFLLTNNSDPNLYLDDQYNWYHVPTDFEYVGVHSEFGKGWVFDIKPYTYDYDNSEKYSNAVPITEASTINGSKTYMGMSIAPCNTEVKGKLPCAVDKYNSYRKYGETSEISNVSKWGTFNAGMWYEWAATNRHQYPTDPLNGWHDQALPNFAEKFWTNSYQPYAEFQFKLGQRWTITPGVKFAYYTIATQQFADDGKTIGCLTPGCNTTTGANVNPAAFITNGGSYFSVLPSGSINYRIRSNWSAYFQGAQGSVVPPSSVFDYAQPTTGGPITPVAQLPKQQLNTTYQAGTVFKLKYATFDADYYHIYFDNSYSCVLNTSSGDDELCFAQPASITQGFEAESNISLTHGLGAYLNASYTRATYTGSESVSCSAPAAGCTTSTPQISVTAPGGLWVAQTPSDIETEGVTYQHRAWDAAFFNKRVGTQYIDNGAYHNQYTVTPFNITNAFVNYTLRTGGRFDNTKFRVSFNNIFNQHNITGNSLAGSVPTQSIAANGTSYTDPFNTTGQTPINGQDNLTILPGRSIMMSVTFGLKPKGR
jgi:iron complex outermembrane receptor protein